MSLYFEEKGIENDQTIIFLHGGGLSGWMWEKQLEHFSDYHCIIPDLPEHGKSKDIKPFTIDCAADQVLDLIKEKSKGKKAHVVGISLGAQIIVQMLSKSPDLIDHVLISGTLVREIPATGLILELLNYTLRAYMPVKDSDFLIKANIRSYGIPKDNFESLKESTKLLDADSLNRILYENLFFKIPEGLEKVKSPVLVLAGEKEYGVIKKSAQDLVEAFPNSQGFIVPKMVHMWNLTNPSNFNTVLRSWISDKRLERLYNLNK